MLFLRASIRGMRKSKIYAGKIRPITINSFLNWRGKECLSIWASGFKDHYIVSGEMSNYEEMKKVLTEAQEKKEETEVKFVKKSGKRFINFAGTISPSR